MLASPSEKSSGQKPLTVIVFGATGDLFQRKLAGALFDLHEKKLLPERTEVVGFSRKTLSHDGFRGLLSEWSLAGRQGIDEEKLEQFVSRAFYHQGDLHDAKSYESLGILLEERDRKKGVCSDKLFYLAVPPNLYETVFTRLAHSGLTLPCATGIPNEKEAWTRVLVEKPFGDNEKEAARLDRLLGSLFEEEQIFRIDHYLAKEAVQNIISFRFSNGLFEPLWSRKHIERMEIRMFEKEGVGERGAFYDRVGALRDVGQNHLLQMLALIVMENPKRLEADSIREARRKVLEKLAPGGRLPAATRGRAAQAGKLSSWVVRGQYAGYRSEKGVAADSDTETYFSLNARVKNSRWAGVPFLLSAGKAQSESRVDISVFFKPAPCLCPTEHETPHQNVLTFAISPREEISVLFWVKRPGFEFGLESKRLSFSWSESAQMRRLASAYERVLFDCIRGDQTLFTSTREVQAQWRFITPILDGWKKLPLQVYPRGSNGLVI